MADTPEIPPHLSALTEQQRLFVKLFVETGNQTEAAAQAGYGGENRKYASQRGYELMRVKRVRDAVTAEQLEHGHSMRSMALKVWRDGLVHPDPKVRLASAKEVADRFGLMKKTKHETEVTHTHQFANMSEDQIKDWIRDKETALKIIDVTPIEEINDAVKELTFKPAEVQEILAQSENEDDRELAMMLAERG